MTYKIIIPSYKRHDIFKTHTLPMLMRTDVKREIYVFVADKDEAKSYRAALPKTIEVVVGKRGIPNQRNFIQLFFPEEERLVFRDDDIKRLVGLTRAGKRTEATKLHGFLEAAFTATEIRGMRMFGINSTDSNLEMKHKVSVGRIYLVGNFYGLINLHDLFVDEGAQIKTRLNFKAGKESHERALLMYERFGGVCKFRSFGVQSKYWGVPGGHQISRTAEGEREATEFLHAKYPDCTATREYKGVLDLVIKPETKVFPALFAQD